MKENPHQWGNPSNARGKVRVHMHGYPGGTVKMLTAEVEAGLFVHYKTCIVICQIGGNYCSGKYFDKIAFETDLNIFSLMLASRGEFQWYSCLFFSDRNLGIAVPMNILTGEKL